ncbi:MAG TPA: NADP-dependent oxidoreductase [Terriglobales bacterium]|jgi:NADPH:quinone reductase-like Zn-dependent oxidoreductase|nr:NADP-dependent oxidoreductase [Terriglobales bacterium]
MKAIRIHEYGDASTLKLEEIPHLSIADDQILVRIHDAGVNPIDWKIRQGYMRQVRPATFPITIGQDFAGEVVEVGKAVNQFAVGDNVFGFAQGTYAEYAAAPLCTVAAIPKSIDFATAAALPTAGLTALQIIRDIVAAKSWIRVLIHGAAGGVGSYASQIAKNLGARVIGTATGADIEYLQSLGVSEVIDYKRERFEDKAAEVDAVVDLVGGETLARSYAVVKKGGVLATTVQTVDESAAKRAGIRAVQVVMKRNAADLSELVRLVEKGALKPRLDKTMRLSEARQAQELSETGKTQGKVILKVA